MTVYAKAEMLVEYFHGLTYDNFNLPLTYFIIN